MTLREHFLELFRYEKWATAKVLDAMKQLPVQDAKCAEWMTHILMAQIIWHSRLVQNGKNYSPWEKKTFDECMEMYDSNTKLWNEYCSTLTDEGLMQIVKYQNTKGDAFESVVKDILIQVINHSTYHRGQIIAKLKGQLPTLPSTDYLFYVREKA